MQPYYEHRDAAVIFIGGHWDAPGVVFVPPAPSLRISFALALPGVVAGPPPMRPPGIFIPPSPGSRPGLIVTAPLGTSPAVVIGAPPVNNIGMRVQTNITNLNNTRITNVTNVTNVIVVAPASATASGRAFEAGVPAQSHLAAALPPVVRAMAPAPQSNRPIPAYRAGETPTPLPPAQAVRASAPAPRPPPPAEPAPAMRAARTRPAFRAPSAATAEATSRHAGRGAARAIDFGQLCKVRWRATRGSRHARSIAAIQGPGGRAPPRSEMEANKKPMKATDM